MIAVQACSYCRLKRAAAAAGRQLTAQDWARYRATFQRGVEHCLAGDEIPVELRESLPYTAPPFVTPGTGRLTLTLLPANQTLLTSNGKAILLKGEVFAALFTVETPATQPAPSGPVPDPVADKPGTAEFIPADETVLAG